MASIKISLAPSPDAASDLLRLGRVRHELWKKGLFQGAPLGAHRDERGRLFFRLLGDFQRIETAVAGVDGVSVEVIPDSDEDECLNCGNRPGDPFPSVCPNCQFRDIEPCPSCGAEIPRRHYENVAGTLCRCPSCRQHVRLEFNPKLLESGEQLRDPAVLVRLERG